MDKKPLSAQIIERKIFEIKDVFVYVFLFVLILSLFLAVIFANNSNEQGFTVTIDGKTALTHVYGEDFFINNDFSDKIEISNEGENYYVKIFSEGGFNLLFVDENAKSVKMQDSDCPSHNCVYMNAISDAGAIYCAPRKLKVSPIKDQALIPPTTGGVS